MLARDFLVLLFIFACFTFKLCQGYAGNLPHAEPPLQEAAGTRVPSTWYSPKRALTFNPLGCIPPHLPCHLYTGNPASGGVETTSTHDVLKRSFWFYSIAWQYTTWKNGDTFWIFLVQLHYTIRLDSCCFSFINCTAASAGTADQVSVLSLKALVIVLGALAGPGWTMMKALVNARDVETQLSRVEMERLWWKSADALPEIKLLRWGSVLAAGRARKSDILKSTEAEGVEAASHSIDFQLVKDATWHRRNLWRMTGSRSGYLVLPSFLGMNCVFLGISMFQAANYACSQGQLSSLELASSLHTLDFKPWQRKYQVHIDTSFKQVVTWHAEPRFVAVGFEFQTSSDLSPSSPCPEHLIITRCVYH